MALEDSCIEEQVKQEDGAVVVGRIEVVVMRAVHTAAVAGQAMHIQEEEATHAAPLRLDNCLSNPFFDTLAHFYTSPSS